MFSGEFTLGRSVASWLLVVSDQIGSLAGALPPRLSSFVQDVLAFQAKERMLYWSNFRDALQRRWLAAAG